MATDIESLIREIQGLGEPELHRLRAAIDGRLAGPAPTVPGEAEFRRRLIAVGLIRDDARPATTASASRARTMATVAGLPLSQSIVEERR